MDESEDYVDLLVGSDEEDDFDLDGHEAPAPTKTAKAVPTTLITAAVALPPVSDHQEDAEMADEDGEIATTPPQPNGRSSAKLSEEGIEDLYHSMNVDGDANLVGGVKYRLDTVHLRGVNDLSTSDVTKIFQDGASIKPNSVEWISDTACNVVFLTELAAATSLYKVSQPLKVMKKAASEDSDSGEAREQIFVQRPPEFDPVTGEELFVSTMSSFPIPVPQGRWRVIKKIPSKAKQIILRFALTTDKKPPNAQKYSQYYEKYGQQSEEERRSYHRETYRNGANADFNSSRADPVASARYLARRRTTIVVPELPPRQHASTPSDRPRQDYHIVVRNGDYETLKGNYVDLDAPQEDAPTLINPPVLVSPRRHGTSPYDRPRSSEETKHFEQGRLPLATNDLRCLLQRRKTIPQNDLRHRLSRRPGDGVGSRPSVRPGDLRSRINRVRENEEPVFDPQSFDRYYQY
ncbi:hypothetical protein RvY_12904 [Ramazzottius varieornatus]|uniref:Nuclear cap-binding protein subunit 3 n=1 Tax=Ramazzottius varieornatus TaxID=947166 RepID=A0A1D1VL32_RAMVA|nr:hypothetical protein RvY_12904 [Ramazzottius varieornatus]